VSACCLLQKAGCVFAKYTASNTLTTQILLFENIEKKTSHLEFFFFEEDLKQKKHLKKKRFIHHQLTRYGFKIFLQSLVTTPLCHIPSQVNPHAEVYMQIITSHSNSLIKMKAGEYPIFT